MTGYWARDYGSFCKVRSADPAQLSHEQQQWHLERQCQGCWHSVMRCAAICHGIFGILKTPYASCVFTTPGTTSQGDCQLPLYTSICFRFASDLFLSVCFIVFHLMDEWINYSFICVFDVLNWKSKNKMMKTLRHFKAKTQKQKYTNSQSYDLKCKKAGNDKDAAKQCPSVILRISELGIRRRAK